MARRSGKLTSPKDYAIAIGLSLILLWLLFLVWGIFTKEEIARHAAYDTKAQLAGTDARAATLAQNLSDLKTERGREASLRDTYGVAKPGEEVIIVVPPEDQKPLGELPWWRKVLGFFGL